MAYESFYGGRQGVSFVIVKNYKSIQEMLDEFAQGGITTVSVNYGEYVLIDTDDKNNPDNGIVYRRELNYWDEGADIPDPLNPGQTKKDPKNPGHGAKYIGQIVGPEGSIKNIEVGDYKEDAGTGTNPGGHGEWAPAQIASGKENNGIKYS